MQVLTEMKFYYFPIYAKLYLNTKAETQQEGYEYKPVKEKMADDKIE